MFQHPHFTSEEAEEITRAAFRLKYETSGPGVINMARTHLRGYLKIARDLEYHRANGLLWNSQSMQYEKANLQQPDIFLQMRLDRFRQLALGLRVLLRSAVVFAPNTAVRQSIIELERQYASVFGPQSFGEKAKSFTLVGLSAIEALRIRLHLQLYMV